MATEQAMPEAPKEPAAPPQPKTIKLRVPVQLGTQLVDELNFRVPTAKDFRGLPLDLDMNGLLKIAGRLCGQTDVVIDRLTGGMTWGDLGEVISTVSFFISGSQKAGSAPSAS